MRTRFLRGTRDQNNGLTLAEGELSIDEETKAVRLHDGATPGGFEIPGTQAYVPVGPGPTTLVGGDTTAGFYGEVPAVDFITGGDLATAVGLSAGTLQHDTTPWLKFALDGKTLFVPQKPIRYSLAWENIYQVGAVYGIEGFGVTPSGGSIDQGTTVNIGGLDYRVRLLRSLGDDPGGETTLSFDATYTHGSEWNRLLYPIHSGGHTNTSNPATHTDPTAAPFASWASYSDAQLLLHVNYGNGNNSWCQETITASTTNRALRGYHGVTRHASIGATYSSTGVGWRPVLELIV